MNAILTLTTLFLARIVLPIVIMMTLGEVSRHYTRKLHQPRW